MDLDAGASVVVGIVWLNFELFSATVEGEECDMLLETMHEGARRARPAAEVLGWVDYHMMDVAVLDDPMPCTAEDLQAGANRLAFQAQLRHCTFSNGLSYREVCADRH